MTEPFDAFARAVAVAAKIEAPGGRLISRLAAGGACHDAPTVFLPGCNLACSHCWAEPGRRDPRGRAAMWTYAGLRRSIVRFRRHNRLGAASDWIRLSGGEPVLSEAFFDLLDVLLSLPGRIYVETNGTLLGAEPTWLDRLIELGPRVRLNVSLKAGTREQFIRITGAEPAAWEAVFACLAGLYAARVPFELNALTRAPELFSAAQRAALLARLAAIHPALCSRLTEEGLTPYPQTLRRMSARRGEVSSGPGSTGTDTSTSDRAGSGA